MADNMDRFVGQVVLGKNDMDIMKYLGEKKPKEKFSTYVKRLIRQDMAKTEMQDDPRIDEILKLIKEGAVVAPAKKEGINSNQRNAISNVFKVFKD